jgi:hypothetical protein
MYGRPVYTAALLVTAGVIALVAAPAAAAQPRCTNTTPTTTQCERAGNSQIVTGPSTNANTAAFPFPEWPWGFGGITIGIGG